MPEGDPRSYTPKHLVEKILQSQSALEGEHKRVTVLFADVKGSMELAEQVDPEEWHGILDRFFQILANGIHRFEGTVNQYTGYLGEFELKGVSEPVRVHELESAAIQGTYALACPWQSRGWSSVTVT